MECAAGADAGGGARAGGVRGGLRLTWCRETREFAALAGEWEALYARCASATPFQSHAWLYSWWLSYGRPGRLRLGLVWEGTRLRAVAPLMAVPFPVPSLVLLGGGVSDFKDVLVDDACREPALRLLRDGLAQAARTRLLDLGEVRPGGAAELLHAAWRGPRRVLDDSLCLHLPALPMDALVARLARPRAQRFRAKLRRIDALGVQRRVVAPAHAGEAVRTLLRLHRLQWQGRGVTPEHLEPRFAAHLERAGEEMVRAGLARLTEFRLDDEVLAVDLTLTAPHLRGGYLYGAHPRLRDHKLDVATMLLSAAVSDLPVTSAPIPGPTSTSAPTPAPTAAGASKADRALAPEADRAPAPEADLPPAPAPDTPGIVSLLRGDEPYKHHWRPETTVNRRLLLASPHTAPLLGVVLLDLAARRRAKAARRWWRQGRGRSGAEPASSPAPDLAPGSTARPPRTPPGPPAPADGRRNPT